jgi:hypothetical protein
MTDVVDVAVTTSTAAPARRRRPLVRRVVAVVAIAGPGLIAANAGNDAAGIATYASAGAQYRYDTLFFMLLVTVALVMVQEMAVRLGAHTGKGLASLIREQFSIRLAGLALVCLVLANTGLVVSEFAGIGAAFDLLGVPRDAAIPVAAAVGARRLRVVRARAAGVPGAVAGVPGVPDRDGARPPALVGRRYRSGGAAHALLQRIHPARRGPDRDDG